MNKYVNPPCKVYSLLPHRSLLPIMSNTEREVGSRSPFGGSVASDEPELAYHEGVPKSSVVPNLQFVPIRMSACKKERSAWGECWRRSRQAIVELKRRVKERVSLTSKPVWRKRLEVSQRDWLWLTFCGVQIRCQKLFWRVWSVFLICHCVSHHSSYSLSFVLRSNIVAIYILH